MELETIIKTDEFKKVVSQIAREQISHAYQDMNEIRRSPAGSIIRIEEEIKSIKQNMVTKEELRTLEGRLMILEGRFERLEGRFKGLKVRSIS
ncbi:MAG: hypothetical protein JSW07_05570 [bacterium]|nr:MAG: hypothetical protein JSW07_05570 [bacterium]